MRLSQNKNNFSVMYVQAFLLRQITNGRASVSPPASVQRVTQSQQMNDGWCWEKHKESAATQPLLRLLGPRAVMGRGQRPALSEPQCRRPCCLLLFCSSNMSFNQQFHSFVPAGDVGCHLAGTWQHHRDPTVPAQGRGRLWGSAVLKQHTSSV